MSATHFLWKQSTITELPFHMSPCFNPHSFIMIVFMLCMKSPLTQKMLCSSHKVILPMKWFSWESSPRQFHLAGYYPWHIPYLWGWCRSVGWSGFYCCSVKITWEKPFKGRKVLFWLTILDCLVLCCGSLMMEFVMPARKCGETKLFTSWWMGSREAETMPSPRYIPSKTCPQWLLPSIRQYCLIISSNNESISAVVLNLPNFVTL